MTKQNAIDNFLSDLENLLRKEIPALVEKIYKEELKIADDRWKNCERKLKEKSND